MVSDNTSKLLKMVLNNQSLLRSEMKKGFNDVDKRFDNVDTKIQEAEKKLTKRIDKIGLDLANISDDTPTVTEFDKLANEVVKIQKRLAVN